MKHIDKVGLTEVQAAYRGAELRLWELIMGQQIHIGGFVSSTDLAKKAGIKAGSTGVDFCCGTGAGMRFLVRFKGAAHMTGVDATDTVIECGQIRCRQEGLSDRITFVLADACQSGLPDASADFVWGEDAWCYVVDKPRLVREAARLVKRGGVIAFTDWVEGEGLLNSEAERFLRFMKFPSMFSIEDYKSELSRAGASVLCAEDTGRFAPCSALYLEMLQMQLTYDALKIIEFDAAAAEALMDELGFAVGLAKAGKILQGLFVAKRS
jgi:SAM-dependent methyltransferase